MVEKKIQKLSLSNTKQEMLEAYNAILKQLQEKNEGELKPEKKMEEKKAKEFVEVADSLSSEGVVKATSDLKAEMGKMLSQLSERMEEEVKKFTGVQRAIEVKQREIEELYEIEKSAATLAALIETQHQKRREFEVDMTERKEELTRDIQTTRDEWEKEKKAHEVEIKERDGEEKKRREREKEEYIYGVKREQQVTKDRLVDEKSKWEREIQLNKEQMEKDLAERQKGVVEKEEELTELRKKASLFPEEVESGVNKAVAETAARITRETNNQIELLKKEFEGEQRVSITRIESLEQLVKGQNEQIAKLSQQLEKAYQKVQDIAVKAVEGTGVQYLAREQTRSSSPEK